MMRADPGIGSEAAAVGTVEWAQRLRLSMQTALHSVKSDPEHFSRLTIKAIEERAWTLMNKPDGSTFASFDEFVEHKEPWGLGKTASEVRQIVEFALGKTVADLATVSEAKEPSLPPGPGRGKKNESDTVSDSFTETHSGAEARKAERLRAIAIRAPEPARDLYKAGLLGQKEAAKLGPKNPKPDEAARVTEIAQALAAEAKALPTTTPAEKEAAKRALNAKARTLLGAPSNLVTSAKAAIARWSREATDDEWRQIVKALDDADTARAERSALQ